MSHLNSFPCRSGTSINPSRNLHSPQVTNKIGKSNSLLPSGVIRPSQEFGYPLGGLVSQSALQSHQYDVGWLKEGQHERKSAREPNSYLASLGQSSPNTSLSSHNDLLRTDSGNSSLSTVDSLSSTSTESHGSSFQATSLDHNFSEDFSTFEEEEAGVF